MSVLLATIPARAAETAAPAGASGASSIVDTNGQETVRSYLQLQEQLHATQLAIERTRREADEASAEMAKAMAARLQSIEQALSTQRAQELQAMQSSNRVMLIVAGGFAALGLAAMLFMAYFQWRTVNRLAEISTALPSVHNLIAANPLPALGAGETHLLSGGSAEQSNARLLGTIDRLEQRIHELEATAHRPANEIAEQERLMGERLAECYDEAVEDSLSDSHLGEHGDQSALISYLADAHAIEQQAIALLERASKTAGDPLFTEVYDGHWADAGTVASLLRGTWWRGQAGMRHRRCIPSGNALSLRQSG
jgi:urease accessory protein UreF